MSKERREMSKVLFDFQEAAVKKMSEPRLRQFAMELRERIADLDKRLYDNPPKRVPEAEIMKLAELRYDYAIVRSACFERLEALRRQKYASVAAGTAIGTAFISCDADLFDTRCLLAEVGGAR